jgi:hypothetical protein
MTKQKLIKQFIVAPGSKVDLKKFRTDWTGTKEAKKLGKNKIKQRAIKILAKNREELAQVHADMFTILRLTGKNLAAKIELTSYAIRKI